MSRPPISPAITTARWVVPQDHPAFAGHFPGTPILPGALLLDVAVQLVASTCGIDLERCQLSSVKFLSPVKPGDELVIQGEMSPGSPVRFSIMAGDRKVASGTFVPVQPA